jgi:hypothetical protein
MQLEGLGKLKKSTSSGLEPTTFQLGAQCVSPSKNFAYRLPLYVFVVVLCIV